MTAPEVPSRGLLDTSVSIAQESAPVPAPTLIVISGPAGSGKTTLAHALARALGCPAICRDEIKEGMVHAHPDFVPGPGDPLTLRTFTVFFDMLDLLTGAGVTTVAEAAFDPVSLPAPSLRVDTTDGYCPGIPDIVRFVQQPS